MALPRVTIPTPPPPPREGGLRVRLENFFQRVVSLVLTQAHEAIEDILSRALLKFLTYQHPRLRSLFARVLDLLSRNPNFPAELRDLIAAAREGEGEVDTVALYLAGIAASLGTISAIGRLTWQDYIYRMIAAYRPERPPLEAMIRAAWRGAISAERYREVEGHIGVPRDLADGVAEVIRPRLTDAELGELRRRRPDLAAAIRDELERRGWRREEIERWEQIQTRVPEASAILDGWLRGELAESEAVRRLGQHGFTDQDARLLMRLAYIIPGPSDLIRMAVREAFDDAIARKYRYDENFPESFAQWAAKQGLSREWAVRYWRAHWELPSPTQVFEMLHRGLITIQDVDEYLRLADYAPHWRPLLRAISYNPVTRVDVRRMYRLGVINREEVKRRYQMLGYTPEDAELLTRFTEKYEGPDGEDERERRRELTRSIIEQAYYKRIIDAGEFRARLAELGYAADDVELLLRLVDARRAVDKAPDLEAERREDIRSIVERLYTRRTLSEAEAREALGAVGFRQTEIDLILATAEFAREESAREATIKLIAEAYISSQMTRADAIAALGELNVPPAQQDTLLREWERTRRFRSRGLTEAAYRRAWKLGIITEEEYREELRGLGYSDRAIEISVRLARAGEESI